jgi:hypothetical protein
MAAIEPAYGYCHALTIDEVIIRMIDFDEKANKAPFWVVLDDWVNEAEWRHEKGQRDSVSPDELDTLKVELERRTAFRTEAMAMHNKLHTAADEIAQGRNHPYLVLSKQAYDQGSSEFTIPSLYEWAKEFWGKEITEWAPSNQQTHDSSQEAEYAPRGSALGDLETLSIIAGAHGRLIDKLVEDERIEHPTGKPCINDDNSEDLLAIAEYIAMSPQPRLSAGNSTVSLGGPPPGKYC